MATKPPTKAQALKRAASTQKALNDLEKRFGVAALDRDRAVLAAQAADATYAEIQVATGLSITRITQVLRRARATF